MGSGPLPREPAPQSAAGSIARRGPSRTFSGARESHRPDAPPASDRTAWP